MRTSRSLLPFDWLLDEGQRSQVQVWLKDTVGDGGVDLAVIDEQVAHEQQPAKRRKMTAKSLVSCLLDDE